MPNRKKIIITALSSAGMLFYPVTASAQIITLLDAIDAILDLDATVTVLGQDVLNLNAAVAVNTGDIVNLQTDVSALTGQVGTNTSNILNLQTDLGTLTGQVGTNTGSIANLQVDLGAIDAQVGINTGNIAGLQTDLTALTGQVATNTGNIAGLQTDLTALTGQVTTNTGDIANLQTDLGAVNAQVGINTGNIAGLQTDLTALTGQVGTNTGNIAALQTGLAANVLRDDGQDIAIATLNTGLAANNLRDDGQDTAISGLTTGLAANSARDDQQDVRLDYQEATLTQHDVRITEARQLGATALATATQVRDDVEAGRVGLVRTESDGNLAIAANMGGSSVSFAGTSGNRRLSGVADGVAANDAATVGQLQTSAAMTLAAAQDYTDGKLVGINNSFLAKITENNQELRTEINAAAASTAALAGLPQAFVPGKGMFAMGIGGKGNQAAIAFGIGKAFNHPNTPVVRAGAAVNTGNGDVTYNAAVGIHF